jgi:CheY-like chemotaxis protein
MNVADGSRGFIDTPACLVVDQAWGGDGLEFIGRLRAAGCHAPAILLVTNPTPAQRARGEVAGVRIIEKPLIGEDLTIALRRLAHGHRVEA